MTTFIIDCPRCRAKVGVTQTGSAERTWFNNDAGEPYGEKLVVGLCPSCSTPLAGHSQQTHFEGWEGDEYNQWTDVVRVHPKPPKTFSSQRIPRTVTHSLLEADRTLQAAAYMATCVMFGRAFEALCRDILEKRAPGTVTKRLMLGAGIKALKDQNIIDQRLYDWGQQLQAFRNLAAHGEDFDVSRDDAEDLQAFMHAIVEYIYDLSDRYEEFQERLEFRKKPRPSVADMFRSAVAAKPLETE
jgi:Domain of unknown function (DUF4145)